MQIYENVPMPAQENSPKFPPAQIPTTKRTIPPINCEYPVTTTASILLARFFVTKLDTTVQKDAIIIKTSPIPISIEKDSKFNDTMPAKPKNAPINFHIENLSSLKNTKEKAIKINAPNCFNSAVSELSVLARPMYVQL